MHSYYKTQEAPYKGPQDLASLLNSDEWSPTSLFPRHEALDRNAFSPKPQPYLNLIKKTIKKWSPRLKISVERASSTEWEGSRGKK
jgi:hypothetical protein